MASSTPTKNNSCYFGCIIRTLVCVILTILLGINSLTNMLVASDEPKCIQDHTFDYTEDINKFLLENKALKNFLLILTALILDASGIYTAILWILKGGRNGKGYKLIMCVVAVYLFKFIISRVFVMRNPVDINIEFPGFPSIFIAYSYTKFPFLSGTAALYVIVICEMLNNEKKLISAITIFGLILYFFLAISLRIEYYVCLFSGIVVAHYSYIIAGMIDKKLTCVSPRSQPFFVDKEGRSIEICDDSAGNK